MFRSILAALALLGGPAMAAAAQELTADAPALPSEPPPGQLLDRVVAIVNDGIVTQSELDESMAMVLGRLRENNTRPPSEEVLRPQVLERLIMDEIQWQRAERVGIEVSDEDLNQELTRLAERNGLTLAQLSEAVAADGLNYAAFRESLRKDIARQMLQQREVRNRVGITPRELEQFMERMRRLPDEQAEYNYSHILIALPTDATQQQYEEIAGRAGEVAERAASEDFARLAIAYSNSQTALEGGQMGWVAGTQLPTLLAETIAALKPGEVSKPVSSPYGFHIVKLNAMRSAEGDPVQEQIHARHILLNPNALQDDATIRQRLADIRTRVLAGEDFAAFASSLSEDESTAVEGGDLGWVGPGATVPEFQAEMTKLQDGEISPPFQTQYGWHIVQVLGRRQFDTTEENLRQRAFSALRQRKADEALESWLRELRDESYVETIALN
jgi:peptidyl-prolyl cis-trans isomerase SurA